MEILTKQFGLLIAYLLPGFVALAGIAPLVPTVAGWLKADQTASFGAPLYALLAATAAGMVVSCFRWLCIDPIQVTVGVVPPAFNTWALEERPAALNFLIENHYRFYQFYANTLVATVWTYAIHRWLKTSPLLGFTTDLGVLVLCVVLFAGARDALSKYRNRSQELVGRVALKYVEGEAMTNGVDHNQGHGNHSEKPAGQSRPAAKPETPPTVPTAPDLNKPNVSQAAN